MTLRNIAAVAIVIATISAQAATADRPRYERILLPVHPLRPVAGALGTLWQTELTVFNAASQPVEVFQSLCSQMCTCAIVTMCIPEPLVPPNGSFRGYSYGSDDASFPNPGAFLYADKAGAENLAFHLRLFDAGHPRATFGTSVPIVRERDMRIAPIVLVDVPVSAAYRTLLRVYGASSANGGSDVRVRIFAAEATEPLSERVLHIVPSERRPLLPAADEFPRFPGYAELLLADAGADRVRVELTPLAPELVYWAFVSVTSNETQEVTIIRPE